MNHGRENRFPNVVPAIAELEQASAHDARAELVLVAPETQVVSGGRSAPARLTQASQRSLTLHSTPRWTRPHRHLEVRIVPQIPSAEERIVFPRIPEGIPEEEGTSLSALATVLLAFHRTVPLDLRDEYVRQVMKFAGEKAGQLVRSRLDQDNQG